MLRSVDDSGNDLDRRFVGITTQFQPRGGTEVAARWMGAARTVSQKCGVITLAWTTRSGVEGKIIGKLDDLGVVYGDNGEKPARLEHLDGTGLYGIFWATNSNNDWQMAQFRSREKPCNFFNPKWTGKYCDAL